MDQLIANFIQSGLYLKNWSPKTVRIYKQCLATLPFEVPTQAPLDSWVIGLRSRGLTPGGVNIRIRTINSYLTWLAEHGHSPKLRVKLLRSPQKVRIVLTADENKLLCTIDPRIERRSERRD